MGGRTSPNYFQGGGEFLDPNINLYRLCIAKSIPVVYFDEPW